MVATPPPTHADAPAGPMAAILAIAARDGARARRFLSQLAPGLTREKWLSLPFGFVLSVGTALRLLAWEKQGFSCLREAGLPTWLEVLRDAFVALKNSHTVPPDLPMAVLRLSLERFAWHAPHFFGGDVTLDDLTDDAALDALAEFLWAGRHAGDAAAGPQP